MSTTMEDWVVREDGVFYCPKADAWICESYAHKQWVVYSNRHGIAGEPTGETDLGKAKQVALQMVFGRLTDELSMIELLLTEGA